MAKKNVSKDNSKKVIRQIVEKNLESLLVKLQPGMSEKKFRKRISRAGKILTRGIKMPEIVADKTAKAEITATAV